MRVKQRTIGLVMLGVALVALLLYGNYALHNTRNPAAENVDISVAWDGTIRFNGQPVSCEEMHAKLRMMDPAPDPADARQQDAKTCAENAKVSQAERARNVRIIDGVEVLPLEGGTVLYLKGGDQVSVDRSHKARWNGKRVSCLEARGHVLATINVRPFPDEKLARLVPCKD